MHQWFFLAILLIPVAAAHGDGGFESPPLDPGQAFSQTFDAPGLVEYECEIHPFMKGTIRVETGSGTPREHEIELQDGETWSFEPSSLTISAGDSVTWTNRGSDVHQVGGTLPGEDQEAPGFAAIAVLAALFVAALIRR